MLPAQPPQPARRAPSQSRTRTARQQEEASARAEASVIPALGQYLEVQGGHGNGSFAAVVVKRGGAVGSAACPRCVRQRERLHIGPCKIGKESGPLVVDPDPVLVAV